MGAPPVVTVGVIVQLTATPTNGVALHDPTVTVGAASAVNVNWVADFPDTFASTLVVRVVVSVTRASPFASVNAVFALSVPLSTVKLTAACGRPLPPLSCTLAITVTPPSSPPIQISNITVDFGDGTSRNLGAPTGATSFTKAYGAEGGYTAVATITDIVGQRGSASCSVVVGRATSPVVTFTQSSDVSTPATTAVPESFTVSATTATGVTLRSIVVTRQNGEVLYNATGSGSFAARVTAGDILTATATDSAGNTGIAQLVVR